MDLLARIGKQPLRLRKELPDMKKIFVEPDSGGDGRGLQFSGTRGAIVPEGGDVDVGVT